MVVCIKRQWWEWSREPWTEVFRSTLWRKDLCASGFFQKLPEEANKEMEGIGQWRSQVRWVCGQSHGEQPPLIQWGALMNKVYLKVISTQGKEAGLSYSHSCWSLAKVWLGRRWGEGGRDLKFQTLPDVIFGQGPSAAGGWSCEEESQGHYWQKHNTARRQAHGNS